MYNLYPANLSFKCEVIINEQTRKDPDAKSGSCSLAIYAQSSISIVGRLHALFMISWKNVKYAYGVSFTPM